MTQPIVTSNLEHKPTTIHDLEIPDPDLRRTQQVDGVKQFHWIPTFPISIIRSQTL
jgi:hypothetical protein